MKNVHISLLCLKNRASDGSTHTNTQTKYRNPHMHAGTRVNKLSDATYNIPSRQSGIGCGYENIAGCGQSIYKKLNMY